MTKLLNAAGAVIIARAGNIDKSDYVTSPVPITVNNRQLAGKGEVTFAWALPLTGMTATADSLLKQPLDIAPSAPSKTPENP